MAPQGGPPQGPSETPKLLGIISLIAGIAAIPSACCCWYLGWIPALVAIGTGGIGLMQAKDDPRSDATPLLIAGIATGAVALVIAVVVILFWAGMTATDY